MALHLGRLILIKDHWEQSINMGLGLIILIIRPNNKTVYNVFR